MILIVCDLALTDRLQIGHITCDNASSNSTMMQEVAACLRAATGRKYNWRKWKIKWVFCNVRFSAINDALELSCTCHQLGNSGAHIHIQQVSTFWPKEPWSTCSNKLRWGGVSQGNCGQSMYQAVLIEAWKLIVIKERSSSKWKAMWKTVQSKAGIARPVQLIVDMKVQWSSTYLMLDRAEQYKTVSTHDFLHHW
jgi:hypothetical protein